MTPLNTFLFAILPVAVLCGCTILTGYLPKRFTRSASVFKIRATALALVGIATAALMTFAVFINYHAGPLLGVRAESFQQPLTFAGAILILVNLFFAVNFWRYWVAIPVRDFDQIAHLNRASQKKIKQRHIEKSDRIEKSAKFSEVAA